ncbi:MBL fold metallo-hydrolase [Geotalea uraniireducens]|uniref:MBL fold metallo-hydrolase n=1 Tax=Geotalea uraniireducens TaxID=351604 RepID=A0ABM8EIL4_9BACT|nr:MBL fold metallo-hydrolase [Geotalea uraniireducens]BDV42093.1 MBL fold metallo-hydrolase [Geotalea uraniireducens]
MRKYLLLLLMVLAFAVPSRALAANYRIEKIEEGVYAAIALPEGKAASNALIIVTPYQVILAGAHFVKEGIAELVADIADITPIPLRYVILTHHHPGYNYVDFDFPANVEVITSWQTWRALKGETRELKNHVSFFDKGLTLIRGDKVIVLTNTEYGHSEGDVFVFLPNEGVMFASDLFFNDVVGYMGEGHLRDWIINVETMEAVGAKYVVPGLGEVSDRSGLRRFRTFLKDFSTEVLRNIEAGKSLEETKKHFSLPRYENLPGYKAFFNVNVERAYRQLKDE